MELLTVLGDWIFFCRFVIHVLWELMWENFQEIVYHLTNIHARLWGNISSLPTTPFRNVLEPSWKNIKFRRDLSPKIKSIVFRVRFHTLLWLSTKVYRFGFSEYYFLLQWVRSRISVSHNITNFREDWVDGTALCALMEALVPGCCPRHDHLHPNHKLVNLDLGLRLSDAHLGVNPKLKADEIVDLKENVEKKVQAFISALRAKTDKLSSKTTSHSNDTRPNCFAKGMGLLMATKNQKASFVIYTQTKHLSYIVIEIQGPNSDYYTEVITHRSPRKKRQILLTLPNEDSPKPENSIIRLSNGRILNIPFEYDILPDRINVSYTPLSVGRYVVSILYRGLPIFFSPFSVIVYEESPRTEKNRAKFQSDSKSVNNSKENLQSLDDSFASCSGGQSPSSVKRKPLYLIVFRKYANIILKPGEALPPDSRAWRALDGPEVSETDLPHNILSFYSKQNDVTDELLNDYPLIDIPKIMVNDVDDGDLRNVPKMAPSLHRVRDEETVKSTFQEFISKQNFMDIFFGRPRAASSCTNLSTDSNNLKQSRQLSKSETSLQYL